MRRAELQLCGLENGSDVAKITVQPSFCFILVDLIAPTELQYPNAPKHKIRGQTSGGAMALVIMKGARALVAVVAVQMM